jgi:hypothetical protein
MVHRGLVCRKNDSRVSSLSCAAFTVSAFLDPGKVVNADVTVFVNSSCCSEYLEMSPLAVGAAFGNL